jgi:hypothetical protein
VLAVAGRILKRSPAFPTLPAGTVVDFDTFAGQSR